MKQKFSWQKSIRLFFAFLSIIAITFIFIDLWKLVSPAFMRLILFFQFVPSATSLFSQTSVYFIGFIVAIILTFFLGRIYCSFLCPLGVLQDVISRLSAIFKIRKKKNFVFHRPQSVFRYSVLTITIISLLTGSMLLIDLLDPYSNYGRISANLFRPVMIGINNLLSQILWSLKAGLIPKVTYALPNMVALVFPLVFLLFVMIMAAFRGRFYCNVVCPVGTFLGLISKFSLFKIRIDKSKCSLCGSCSKVCKAECINLKNQAIDMSRCVGCMNCIDSCSESGINYYRNKLVNSKTDEKRRMAIMALLSSAGGILAMSPRHRAMGEHRYKAGEVPVKKNHPCSPPGSKSISHFTTYCTACHLCVSACPTQVLQPSLFHYGIEGMLQPMLDPQINFCNYDCTICSEVCPSGAILLLTKEQKHKTQVGRVHFIKQSCVVFTDLKDCGSCSEHCPTKAVQMVSWKHGLKIPEINNEICVGCNACEYACPTKPYKAIYVDGNSIHQLAKQPEKEVTNEGFNPDEDFPF